MKLSKLLEHLNFTCIQGSTDTDITDLLYDSRKVHEGSVFVCISGSVRDAHEFIPEVIEKGAAAVVVEKDNAATETLHRGYAFKGNGNCREVGR